MAATAPILHGDTLNDAMMVGENLNLAKSAGLLADADVGASKTYLTMQAAIATAASTKPTEFQGFVGRLQRALKLGFDIGVLTDANVQGVTTIAELVAITPADPNKIGPIFIE
jgi:hypothetical protein